ncbi:Hypothetical Protein FCC1311_058332 [Hondaea fermentalgiana]|uniref:Uncharacterized protein n=1 Tax=Hondaea fermentalgiana TaxID=2315210 RepID=A0A2R5GFA7_9STRA|nr:Hypothetical Protein FCC1311_058332 [Hondaea fermentalgiana]|eukprot:GBG29612.1 Hypothetical Protein FCC1311_058332 [Hondaea fermentalgiana]
MIGAGHDQRGGYGHEQGSSADVSVTAIPLNGGSGDYSDVPSNTKDLRRDISSVSTLLRRHHRRRRGSNIINKAHNSIRITNITTTNTTNNNNTKLHDTLLQALSGRHNSNQCNMGRKSYRHRTRDSPPAASRQTASITPRVTAVLSPPC